MRKQYLRRNKDPLDDATWTNALYILLEGCSCPLHTWSIEQLKFRFSFQEDFWSRLAIIKHLLARGVSWDEVGVLEKQSLFTMCGCLD